MGQSKHNPSSRTYSKTNFVELIELLTPEIYQTEDISLSGFETNPLSRIINSNINAANNFSDIISVSAVTNQQTSSLGNISGVAQYFVKQNDLTNITPFLFETKILLPLGRSLSNFTTSGDFHDYLSGTLLPQIVVADTASLVTSRLEENITTLSSLTSNSNTSSVHEYLLDSLGWFYLLNTSGDGRAWEPSGFVLSSLDRLYLGETIETVDGLKGLTEFIWRNYEVSSQFQNLGLLPPEFVSSISDSITEVSSGIPATHTSGIQRMDSLVTLVDAIYSPRYLDEQDFKVKDAFDDYISAELLLEDQVSKGPFRKFQNIMGLSMADVSDEVENIGLIYDIENVKDEHLQYIAELIGWKLRGATASKWRDQLRNAVDIYKRKGTLASIQKAVDSLIVDSVFDVSGQVQELWESYIPFLIWYALGTESPLFQNLTTWTPALAQQSQVNVYNTSSLETNIKLVTDSILLEMYKEYPDNFIFFGEKWDPPRLFELDSNGCITKLYTIVGDPVMKPFHAQRVTDGPFQSLQQSAKRNNEGAAWDASLSRGPLGYGVYMAGESVPPGERPLYLSAAGDLEFVFNYRGKVNFPIPPFEEVKYYRDSTITPQLVEFLVEKLKCFQVKDSFADQLGNFIVEEGISVSSNLGSLNEFLLLFSSVQTAPNYNDVMLSQSNYEKNLLNLWNGKSSHLFIDFDNTDFDFSKTTMEGDGKYALLEASRIAREFSPAHAITRVNLNASADEVPYEYSSVAWDYLGLNKDDDPTGSTSGVLGGYEYSGVAMATYEGNAGRGGLNTFKRHQVSSVHTTLLSGIDGLSGADSGGAYVHTVPRRSVRRRNFKFTLPKEGYYDRTGFNPPVNWDASTVEHSYLSSLGELTLGYIPSAGIFHPIADPVNPSGVWHACETLDSTRTFSSIDTSNTFPYRGLSSVAQNNNAKYPEFSPSATQYVDRGQTPGIYITMHKMFEAKAKDSAFELIKEADNKLSYADAETWDSTWMVSSYQGDAYWKNQVQSLANTAIASGLVINSYDDYLNFQFGKGLHTLHKDYYTSFGRHNLPLNAIDETGGNIFAHVFGKGLYNCDFDVTGYAVSTVSAGNYVASSFTTAVPINNDGSGVFSLCAIDANHDLDIDYYASGTVMASSMGDMIVPLSGTYTIGNPLNAEFRNPNILSGVEFVQPSGCPVENEFRIFKVDPQHAEQTKENFLVNNTFIKCKNQAGLPRIRFDLSSYGDRVNKLVKDHQFKLTVNSLVADERLPYLGGGKLGVWIHTGTLTPTSRLMWSWTPQNNWQLHSEADLSMDTVLGTLAHTYEFNQKTIDKNESVCLGNLLSDGLVNDIKLSDLRKNYFDGVEILFDTRNYTIFNNAEYLQVLPVPEEYYQYKDLVHGEDTDYYVEVFFLPNNDPNKYMVIDSIELQDLTLRENAAIGTGHGIRTKGIPLRPFVREDKLYLEKEQLRDVLKFYNGLAGLGSGEYATNLAARDSTITAAGQGAEGGSRLNYRISPEWLLNTKQSTYNNYETLEFDN